METQSYDAIVIGSGISGGWAAKELTERGLKVLMLERGRNIEHIKDYVSALKQPWELSARGKLPPQMLKDHPVRRRDSVLNEAKPDWWVDEAECPCNEAKP